MRRQGLSKVAAAAVTTASCLWLGGCTSLGYYAQAAQGQYSLLAQAKPIDAWLADPQTSEQLRNKLQTVREIRRFAVEQLDLPDNGSYKSYVQLPRPFVVWNVVAAPALSLQARKWCFPIAGCVDYRGYYDEQEAQTYADSLAQEGYDVQVAGVPAYSTLGWFNDPVMSTFINYPDGELARLIFHELAHQLLYVKGDTQFNESYATTVEELGVERWLQRRDDAKLSAAYQVFAARRQGFLALLLKYRAQLDSNYRSGASDEEKLQRKAQLFDALRADYQQLKQSWNGFAGYDRWFAMPLSNAHLALIGAYHDRVPAFRALFQQSGSFVAFFAQVKKLAALDKGARDLALDRLQASIAKQ